MLSVRVTAMTATTVVALLLALRAKNHRAFMFFLKRAIRTRTLRVASLPAAVALIMTAHRFFQKYQSRQRRERSESVASASSVASDEQRDHFSALSTLMVPRVLSRPIDSVRAFYSAQAEAAGRGWGHMQDLWHDGTAAIGDRIQQNVESTLSKSTDAVLTRIKASVIDPDMPIVVQELVGDFFSEISPSVHNQVLVKADELLFTPVRRRIRKRQPQKNNIAQLRALMPHIRRFRAEMLYGMDPCDKSIWRCIRSKRWWALHVVGIMPWVGPLWWVAVFCMKDKADEFQLVDFIVGTETAKFLSVGCLSLITGTLRYYVCSSVQLYDCETHGPRVALLDIVFFFVQIFLVWGAFWMLPYSNRLGRTKRRPADDFDDGDGPTGAVVPPGRLLAMPQGGTVRRMFWYLTTIILMTLVLVGIAYLLSPTHWQLVSTLYWIRCAYGLLSLPFVIFKIPVVSKLLVPARKTAYNPLGATVLHKPVKRLANATAGDAQM